MNERIQTTRGEYEYDPDYDMYRPVQPEPTVWNTYGWIAVCAVLGVIAYILS